MAILRVEQLAEVRDQGRSDPEVRPELAPSLHPQAGQMNIPAARSTAATKDQRQRWPDLADLPITDPENLDKAELLIGTDDSEALIPHQIVTGKPGEPFGMRTLLGWTVTGTISGEPTHPLVARVVATAQQPPVTPPVSPRKPEEYHQDHHVPPPNRPRDPGLDSRLKRKLDRTWPLEQSLYDTTRGRSQEDEEVMAMWNQTVSKVNGHYQLPIRSKSKNPELPNARSMAKKRLSRLAKKLRRSHADALRKSWKQVQYLADLLWKRWLNKLCLLEAAC